MADTDTSGGDDGFEAEFEAARDAEREPSSGAEAADIEFEDVSEGEGAANEAPAVEKPKAAETESEKAAKSLQKALKQERRERQALQAQIEDLRRQVPQQFAPQQRSQSPSFDPSAFPDPDTDPLGAIRHATEILRQHDQAQRQSQDAQTLQAQEHQVLARTFQAMATYEEDYREEQPAYDQAVDHLRKSAIDEYLDAGFSAQQAEQRVKGDFIAMTQQAIAAGRDPAELAFKMATKRGFKAGGAVDPVAQKMDAIRSGQRAASPLNGGSGSSGKKPLTAAYVATLDGAAFDKGMKALEAQAKRTGNYR